MLADKGTHDLHEDEQAVAENRPRNRFWIKLFNL